MKTVLHIFMIIFSMLAIWSCRSVQYVPVESVKTDSIYMSVLHTDSIYVRDSTVLVVGDTVTLTRWKYVYRYRDLKDTIYMMQADTVRIPYPVERPLTVWEKIKLTTGGFAVVAIVVTILIVVGRMIYKLKK